ncbi:MAG TPA: MmgE/PrpD family protein [Burkholderiales bacterium]|nr:MmgE/PrpD family protein [Burkholderiales bacterium]
MSAVPKEITPGAGATQKLAEHVAHARYEKLSAKTVHAYKRAFQDHLTCAIAGAAMPVSQALLDYFSDTDASRTATVVGTNAKLSAQNAALVNGANTHALDFDDGHTNGSAHPSGAIFPAVLATAQQYGSSPREIILAAVMGYDVMCRIAAAGHPATARRGWHNTPLAGVFGAAAAVSKLLGLNAEQTRNALGLAGSFSGGIREYLDEGAEIKRIHPGKAARDGLICAEFAKRGITGPAKVLEGRYGWGNIFASGEMKWDRLLLGIGERYEIEHAYFKPYPCCRHYHAVIDGILALRAQHGFTAKDVKHIAIGLYAVGFNGHDHKHYENLLDAQMSAPVAAALAVVDGEIAAHRFVPESLERPEVQRLVEAADAAIDDECERIYPGRRSGYVRIDLADGRSFDARVLDPKGEGESPMTDDDLRRKFNSNCEPVIGKAQCERLGEIVWNFEQQTDTQELLRVVIPDPRQRK